MILFIIIITLFILVLINSIITLISVKTNTQLSATNYLYTVNDFLSEACCYIKDNEHILCKGLEGIKQFRTNYPTTWKEVDVKLFETLSTLNIISYTINKNATYRKISFYTNLITINYIFEKSSNYLLLRKEDERPSLNTESIQKLVNHI